MTWPLWKNESERLEYEWIVEQNPKRADESQMDYIVRVHELAEARVKAGVPAAKPARPLPEQRPLIEPGWLPYKDPDDGEEI